MLNLFAPLFGGKPGKPGAKKAAPARAGKAKSQKAQVRPLPRVVVPASVDAIDINYMLFPKIKLGTKPKNTEYEEIRKAYADQVFKAITPYYRFLVNMRGVRDDKAMQLVIRDVIYRFIVHFWNIPSSRNHHHSNDWGGLVHALDTACREALLWQEGKIFSEFGVDSERTRKEPVWQAFAGFVVGMFHDVAKIFDMEIVSAGQRPVKFRTLEGELLDFHLVHPEGVKRIWKHQKPSLRVNWNMMYVWTFVPQSVWKAMPHDLMIQAMYKLLSYEALSSDHASVRNWTEKDEFNQMVVQAIGQWFLQAPDDFRQGDKSPFHRLDSNWVACDARGFIHELANRLGHKATDLMRALTCAGIVAKHKDTGKFYTKLELEVGGATIKRDTCFMSVLVFNQAFDKIAKGKEAFRLGNKAASIAVSSLPAAQEIMSGVAPGLADYVTLGLEKGEGKKKPKGGKPRQKKVQDTPEPPAQISIDSAMPMVEPAPIPDDSGQDEAVEVQTLDLLEDTAPAPEEEAPAAPDAAPEEDAAVDASEEPLAEEAVAAQVPEEEPEHAQEERAVAVDDEDAGEALESPGEGTGGEEEAATEESIDQHIAAANPGSEGLPFWEEAGGKITPEQAHSRFVLLLEVTAAKTKAMQRSKGSNMWLSTSGQLYLRAPAGVNDVLGLNPIGRLSDDQVALRSKFFAALEKLGYVRESSGGASQRQKINFYLDREGDVAETTVYLTAVELAHEKIMGLCPAFAERLKGYFSRNSVARAQEAAGGVGEADV